MDPKACPIQFLVLCLPYFVFDPSQKGQQNPKLQFWNQECELNLLITQSDILKFSKLSLNYFSVACIGK